MKLDEIMERLLTEDPYHGALVMVQFPGHGPLSIKAVEVETHFDADGSQTVWLHVEES